MTGYSQPLLLVSYCAALVRARWREILDSL